MDYWALGHIHKRQVLSARHPAAIYPGNIQARHLKETGPKGYYLVRAANGEMSWEFKEAHDVLWEEIDLDISGAEHMTSLLKAASDTFSGLRAAGRPACVRLVLRGAAPALDGGARRHRGGASFRFTGGRGRRGMFRLAACA